MGVWGESRFEVIPINVVDPILVFYKFVFVCDRAGPLKIGPKPVIGWGVHDDFGRGWRNGEQRGNEAGVHTGCNGHCFLGDIDTVAFFVPVADGLF